MRFPFDDRGEPETRRLIEGRQWGEEKDAFADELFDFSLWFPFHRTPRHIQIWVSTGFALYSLFEEGEERTSFLSIRADLSLLSLSSRVPLSLLP